MFRPADRLSLFFCGTQKDAHERFARADLSSRKRREQRSWCTFPRAKEKNPREQEVTRSPA